MSSYIGYLARDDSKEHQANAKEYPMKCNHEAYLREQELECRRIARSSNEGTQTGEEWFRTAQALLERRREHIKVCDKCSKES